jgi:hypothetical protein
MNDDGKALDPTCKCDGARTSQRSLRVTGDGSSAGWAASAIYQDIAKDTTFGPLEQSFCSLLNILDSRGYKEERVQPIKELSIVSLFTSLLVFHTLSPPSLHFLR